MAYRELGMVEVHEILRRWQGGAGVRAIARGAGVDRKTIAACVQAAVAVGLQRGGSPPTDEQLSTIAAARRPGRPPNASAPSPELERLRPHAPTIQQWLAEGLRLTKISGPPPGVGIWRARVCTAPRVRCPASCSVGREGDRRALPLGDHGDGLPGALEVAVDAQDLRALAGEGDGRRAAVAHALAGALARSDDDGDPILQAHAGLSGPGAGRA
jgi:hypothetical protein